MSRTYTLNVDVSKDTLQTLVDGKYKLILGTEHRGIKTPLPDWEPNELPGISRSEKPSIALPKH